MIEEGFAFVREDEGVDGREEANHTQIPLTEPLQADKSLSTSQAFDLGGAQESLK